MISFCKFRKTKPKTNWKQTNLLQSFVFKPRSTQSQSTTYDPDIRDEGGEEMENRSCFDSKSSGEKVDNGLSCLDSSSSTPTLHLNIPNSK